MRDIISNFFIGAPENIYPHMPPDDDISLCELAMVSFVTWKKIWVDITPTSEVTPLTSIYVWLTLVIIE